MSLLSVTVRRYDFERCGANKLARNETVASISQFYMFNYPDAWDRRLLLTQVVCLCLLYLCVCGFICGVYIVLICSSFLVPREDSAS